jgi:hypothetical protein
VDFATDTAKESSNPKEGVRRRESAGQIGAATDSEEEAKLKRGCTRPNDGHDVG